MCEAPRRQAAAGFNNHAYYESDEEAGISSFGCPKMNHGWIECVSTSYPGKTYYYNVATGCATWHRPVSRFVPTRFSRPLALLSDDDFLNVAPLEVSDIEDQNDYEDDDDYDSYANLDLPPDADDVPPPRIIARDTERSTDSKVYADVLFKLYHCNSGDWKDNEIEGVVPFDCETLDEDDSENFAPIAAETCYSSDSDGPDDSDDPEGTDRESTVTECETTAPEEKTSETSENDESLVEVSREDSDELSELDGLKVLHGNDSEMSESRENSLDISVSSATDTDIGSRQMGLSSDDEDDEEDAEENEEDEKYQRADDDGLFSLPRLKAIEYEDLSRPRKLRKKKWKKRKANKNGEEPNGTAQSKMIKIVCEVNGVTTVNYDYIAPDLPFGAKMSNLSDSGSNVDSYARPSETANDNCPNDNADAVRSFGFLDEPMDIDDPDLSDSSTTSTSSASSVSSAEARRIRAAKVLANTRQLTSQENASRHSFKSSSSSESSWNNSGKSSDDDD